GRPAPCGGGEYRKPRRPPRADAGPAARPGERAARPEPARHRTPHRRQPAPVARTARRHRQRPEPHRGIVEPDGQPAADSRQQAGPRRLRPGPHGGHRCRRIAGNRLFDVTLAEASGAVIAAFNVRANAQARQAAERADVEIRYYNVIYDLVDDVKAAMSGMLEPELRETFLGNAEILEIFNVSKVGKVAGCRVTEGTVERGAKVRLIRDNVVIHEGQLASLKRFKDEVREVKAGQECGMAFENYQDMR